MNIAYLLNSVHMPHILKLNSLGHWCATSLIDHPYIFFNCIKNSFALLKKWEFLNPISPVNIYSLNPPICHLYSRSLKFSSTIITESILFHWRSGNSKSPEVQWLFTAWWFITLCSIDFIGPLVMVHDKYALSEQQFWDSIRLGAPKTIKSPLIFFNDYRELIMSDFTEAVQIDMSFIYNFHLS